MFFLRLLCHNRFYRSRHRNCVANETSVSKPIKSRFDQMASLSIFVREIFYFSHFLCKAKQKQLHHNQYNKFVISISNYSYYGWIFYWIREYFDVFAIIDRIYVHIGKFAQSYSFNIKPTTYKMCKWNKFTRNKLIKPVMTYSIPFSA